MVCVGADGASRSCTIEVPPTSSSMPWLERDIMPGAEAVTSYLPGGSIPKLNVPSAFVTVCSCKPRDGSETVIAADAMRAPVASSMMPCSDVEPSCAIRSTETQKMMVRISPAKMRTSKIKRELQGRTAQVEARIEKGP